MTMSKARYYHLKNLANELDIKLGETGCNSEPLSETQVILRLLEHLDLYTFYYKYDPTKKTNGVSEMSNEDKFRLVQTIVKKLEAKWGYGCSQRQGMAVIIGELKGVLEKCPEAIEKLLAELKAKEGDKWR
jgi:hypothetical protein